MCQAVNDSYHAAKVIAFDMLHRAAMQALTFLRFLRHSGRTIQRSDYLHLYGRVDLCSMALIVRHRNITQSIIAENRLLGANGFLMCRIDS